MKICQYMAIVFHFHICSGTFVYRYNATPVTWEHAQSECQNRGGHLINDSVDAFLINCTIFPKHQNFWTGQYEHFSEWIQIIGCFTVNTTQTTVQYYADNSVQCSVYCGQIFGLMGTECFCLSDSVLNKKPLPDVLCSNTCSDPKDSCGGDNYMTVYNTIQDSDVTDRDDEKFKANILCGLVECTNNGWKYFGYSCNQSLPALCNDMNKTVENRHWEDGQQICWSQYQSFLLGSSINAVNCNVNETSRAPYWIGMYRGKLTKNIDGNLSSTPTSCFHGTVTDYVLQQDNDIPCQTLLPYVCYLETDNILENDCFDPLPLEKSTVYIETSANSTTAPVTTVKSTSNLKTTTPLTTATITILKSLEDTVSSKKDIGIGVGVGVGLGLGIPLIAIIGTVICHYVCGRCPKCRDDSLDTASLRNKKEFYIRPRSDISEMSQRYSFFEDIKDDDKAIITYGQKQDGRISTFVCIPAQVNGILINDDDIVTKL